MSDLVGQWVQQNTFENMEAFLEAVGVQDAQIKGMICSLKPELHLTVDGDQWLMEMITPHGTRKASFASGDEIDYVSIVGRPVKSTMTIEGNTLLEVHRDPSGTSPSTYITREVRENEMHVVLKVNGVEARALYKRSA